MFSSKKFRLFWEVFRFLSDSARGKISLCDVIPISIVILIPCSFSEKSNSVQPIQSSPSQLPKPQKRKKSESEKTDTSKYFWLNYPGTGYIIAALAKKFFKFSISKIKKKFEFFLFWKRTFSDIRVSKLFERSKIKLNIR